MIKLPFFLFPKIDRVAELKYPREDSVEQFLKRQTLPRWIAGKFGHYFKTKTPRQAERLPLINTL
jgi:hypothetical protein